MHRMKKTGLGLAALLIAGVTGSEPSFGAQGEVIVIRGDVEPYPCESAWGIGYEEVWGPDGELEGCTCKFGMDGFCGEGYGFGWSGDWELPPGGDSRGGDRGGDCEADDEVCLCAEAEPAEPELCTVSCGDCQDEKADCAADVEQAAISCQDHNRRKAHFMCSTRGGLEFGYGRTYADVESCIEGRTKGFPGLREGESQIVTSGWSFGVNGGAKFDLGIAEVGVGASGSINGSHTTGRSSMTTYPPAPVDRTNFIDCIAESGQGYEVCSTDQELCVAHVTSVTGETCEEEPVPITVSADSPRGRFDGSHGVSSATRRSPGRRGRAMTTRKDQ